MGVRITRVVASHAHLDHIMAARAIVEATGAPFLLHQSDLPIAENMPTAARMWMGREVPPAPVPDAFPTDGQDLEIAGVTVRVIFTSSGVSRSLTTKASAST